jgi:hypothetical protein
MAGANSAPANWRCAGPGAEILGTAVRSLHGRRRSLFPRLSPTCSSRAGEGAFTTAPSLGPFPAFADEGGRTKLTTRMLFPSAEALENVKKFGAVEGANQTLDRFAEHLAAGKRVAVRI